MKVSILGTGDLEIIIKYSNINKKKLQKLLIDTAKLLISLGIEIIILPARGIPYEFAKIYKRLGGKKIYGTIPKKCPFYGKYTKNILEKYVDVIDEEIDFNSWYDVNGNIATLGDFTICFGLSAGVMAEISEMKYNLKYRGRKTKLIIFKNTISKKLHKEVEESIKLIYVSSVKDLMKILNNKN